MGLSQSWSVLTWVPSQCSAEYLRATPCRSLASLPGQQCVLQTLASLGSLDFQTCLSNLKSLPITPWSPSLYGVLETLKASSGATVGLLCLFPVSGITVLLCLMSTVSKTIFHVFCPGFGCFTGEENWGRSRIWGFLNLKANFLKIFVYRGIHYQLVVGLSIREKRLLESRFKLVYFKSQIYKSYLLVHADPCNSERIFPIVSSWFFSFWGSLSQEFFWPAEQRLTG